MNVRAIYGCRQVGSGHEHSRKLCCYLNMPESMLSNNYQNILLKLKQSTKRVADETMLMALSKLRGAADSVNVDVSVDETWQLKGVTSLIGVVTAISIDSGKSLIQQF